MQEDFESAAESEGLEWGPVKRAFIENPSEMHLVFERLEARHKERVSGLGGLMGGFSVEPRCGVGVDAWGEAMHRPTNFNARARRA